jgi:hypothetical protein
MSWTNTVLLTRPAIRMSKWDSAATRGPVVAMEATTGTDRGAGSWGWFGSDYRNDLLAVISRCTPKSDNVSLTDN